MDMDGTTEEFVGSTTSNNHDASATHIVKAKGKRTKRQRPLSPLNCALAATMMTSSSSTASGDDHHVSDGGDYGSFSSTTTTYESTEEEEDMANCLILLAQGGDPHNPKQPDQDQAGNHTQRGSSSSRKFAEMAPAAAAASKIGFYIYECKTCNRTFPSFQALGGHRASHKKPKPMTAEEKKLHPPPPSPKVTSYELEDAGKADIKSSPPISLQFNKAVHSNKAKIHECSICGSEFTSGQALGGHMRRHRASTNNSTQVVAAAAAEEVKPRNVLQLDLNLPAPEDVDLRDSKFQFKATQKTLVLSAPPLVGCHY